MPPTANAGKDQTITLPANSVSFQETEQMQMEQFHRMPGQRFRDHPVELINNANSASAIQIQINQKEFTSLN